MSIYLEQFHQIFFEESFEGLEVMESGLLKLDLESADIEEINTIFRAAHSIKGGSGTFGFTEISRTTHVMETLLDELRDGRRKVTRSCIDLLLESVDCLRDMLSSAKAGEVINYSRTQEIHRHLEKLLHEEQVANSVFRDSSTDAANSITSGWRIKFRPYSHLFLTGNDPIRLLRELGTLGELESTLDVSRLPPFSL